jgi:hypothetical protein
LEEFNREIETRIFNEIMSTFSFDMGTEVVGSELEVFQAELKEAIDSADLDRMYALMAPGTGDDPLEVQFWAGAYYFEAFPMGRDAVYAGWVENGFDGGEVDIGDLADLVLQDLIEPRPAFNGPIVHFTDTEGDSFLLEIREISGEYYWTGMVLYTNEETPFGPVPPRRSLWDFSDLNMFLRVLDWAIHAEHMETLALLTSDPFYQFHCATLCWGPDEHRLSEIEQVFTNVFLALEQGGGVYYGDLREESLPRFIEDWDSNLRYYTITRYGPEEAFGGQLHFGISYELGRYHISALMVTIQ